MSRIRVIFDERSREVRNTPVPVEIFDERLVPVARHVIRLGDSRSIDIGEPGLYHVRAELPTGESIATTVKLEDQHSDVLATLVASENSPRESLAWAYSQQSVRRVVGEHSVVTLPVGFDSLAWRYRILRGAPSFSSLAGPSEVNVTGIFRMVDEGSSWELVPAKIRRQWDSSVAEADPRLVAELRLPSGGRTPLLIRMQPAGRSRREVTLVSVPTSFSPRVLFLRDYDTRTVRMLVAGARPEPEALLAYMQIGAVGAARRIGPSVVESASEAVQTKTEDPFGASIAGYFLLGAAGTERQDWMKNLADRFPSLADGAVIYAVSLLRGEGAEGRRADAREYLLRAVHRGLPTYTVGLRYLFDSLQYLARDDTDAQVTAALARVRFVAAYTDWDAQTTTFSIPVRAASRFFRFLA